MKDPKLKTKRLLLTPMTDEELETLARQTDDPGLRAAYGEMLDGCRRDAANRLWYTAWRIALKDGGQIGSLGFKGPAKNAAVEIGYGVDEPQRLRGYATEAAQALIEWAFSNDEVTFVEAETEADNIASKRVLEKLGFQPDGEGAEGPRFVLEQAETSWISIYLCLGLSIGIALGSSLGSRAIGTSTGLCLGLCLGAALDASQKKKREELRKNRKNGRAPSDPS